MISHDIKMKFGLDKCAKAIIKGGKKVSTEGIQLPENNVIQELEPEATYTYIGLEGGYRTGHHKLKVRIQKECEKDQTSIQV